MTALEGIKARVADLEDRVKHGQRDPEAWHSSEDTIMLSALEAIANGSQNPRAIARAALRIQDMKFPHWCA